MDVIGCGLGCWTINQYNHCCMSESNGCQHQRSMVPPTPPPPPPAYPISWRQPEGSHIKAVARSPPPLSSSTQAPADPPHPTPRTHHLHHPHHPHPHHSPAHHAPNIVIAMRVSHCGFKLLFITTLMCATKSKRASQCICRIVLFDPTMHAPHFENNLLRALLPARPPPPTPPSPPTPATMCMGHP
jgi:hypothetical protein